MSGNESNNKHDDGGRADGSDSPGPRSPSRSPPSSPNKKDSPSKDGEDTTYKGHDGGEKDNPASPTGSPFSSKQSRPCTSGNDSPRSPSRSPRRYSESPQSSRSYSPSPPRQVLSQVVVIPRKKASVGAPTQSPPHPTSGSPRKTTWEGGDKSEEHRGEEYSRAKNAVGKDKSGTRALSAEKRGDSTSEGENRRRNERGSNRNEVEEKVEEAQKPKKVQMDLLRTRTGGAYIPPAKLKMMQDQIADKGSEQYQRMNWERLKKKIHGQVNKANTSNLVNVVRDLLQENIIRGKGLLARSIIQAQSFSPTFSNVYAALVAVINSKFPHIGELILRRLIVQFKRCFRRNDKATTVTVSKFIAHLINQNVAHEVLALELMILLLENPTDDSVEVTVAFLKECGRKLSDLSPRGVNSIFDRLRSILNEAEIDKRVQYMIEVIFHIRKDGFKAYPIVLDDLDLIDEDDQITHTITLEDAVNPENELNVFKFDPEFEKNEAMYDEIRREIIGDAGESSDEDEEEEDEGEEDAEEADKGDGQNKMTIIDNTEQNLVAFRRNVYLTIQSSLDFQEAAHKLLKIDLKTGQDVEMCHMIVDCCAQQRTYESFFGLLAERFCRLRKEFQEAFESIARDTYHSIHRFDITKLRNMARLVAHLLSSDAISWDVLSEIKLNEEDTTSSGRIYIKIVFQELAEFMSVEKLMERIRDPTLQHAFDQIFPRDNPNNTRFSINFFTSIGLGYLSMDLRKHLQQSSNKRAVQAAGTSSDSSSDSSDSSSESESSSDSDSSDSSSSDDDRKKAQKKHKQVAEAKVPEEAFDKENRQNFVLIKQEPVSPSDVAPKQQVRKEGERSRGKNSMRVADKDKEEERSRTRERRKETEKEGSGHEESQCERGNGAEIRKDGRYKDVVAGKRSDAKEEQISERKRHPENMKKTSRHVEEYRRRKDKDEDLEEDLRKDKHRRLEAEDRRGHKRKSEERKKESDARSEEKRRRTSPIHKSGRSHGEYRKDRSVEEREHRHGRRH